MTWTGAKVSLIDDKGRVTNLVLVADPDWAIELTWLSHLHEGESHTIADIVHWREFDTPVGATVTLDMPRGHIMLTPENKPDRRLGWLMRIHHWTRSWGQS